MYSLWEHGFSQSGQVSLSRPPPSLPSLPFSDAHTRRVPDFSRALTLSRLQDKWLWDEVFGRKQDGVFVDVGAFDGQVFFRSRRIFEYYFNKT